jgi:hypothetical protein
MEGFVIRENIKHYLELLERTTDQRERSQIRTLLAEERRKQREREGARRTCASQLTRGWEHWRAPFREGRDA